MLTSNEITIYGNHIQFTFLWAMGIVNIIFHNFIISYKFLKFNIKLFPQN
jgi:hypothetical protein